MVSYEVTPQKGLVFFFRKLEWNSHNRAECFKRLFMYTITQIVFS